MKIYVFTICQTFNGQTVITISQVYAESRFKAMISLQLITGCNEADISYQGKEETAQPQFWDAE